MKKDEKGYAAVHQSGRQHFRVVWRVHVSKESQLPKMTSFVFQQLEVNRPQKPPVKTKTHHHLRLPPPTVLIQLVLIQFLPQETSTKVEGLQGRQSAREESFQAAEEMKCRSKGAGCGSCVPWQPKHPIKKLVIIAKHMTCIPLYYICTGTLINWKEHEILAMFQSESKIQCPSGSFAAGRGG